MGWTSDELLREVMDLPARAFVPNPDTEVIERDGWHQLVTPSFRTGGLNGVNLCTLTELEADAAIDDAIARYAKHDLRFRWTVGPSSAPADLAERLERRGLQRSHIVGMFREVTPIGVEIAGVKVEQVNANTVGEFTRAMAEGWAVEPEPLEAYNRLVLEHPAAQRLYLARIEGEVAGTAGLAIFERSVYLVGAVVLAKFRGRGVYRALTEGRLAVARHLGKSLATCQAREDSSAPILAKLGFESVGRFAVFSNR